MKVCRLKHRVRQISELSQRLGIQSHVLGGLVVRARCRWSAHVSACCLAFIELVQVVSGGRRYLAGDTSPLPNLTDVDGDLKLIGIRFLGYLVAIAVLYIVRRIVMNR